MIEILFDAIISQLGETTLVNVLLHAEWKIGLSKNSQMLESAIKHTFAAIMGGCPS